MKGLTRASILSIGIVATLVVAAAIYLLGIRPTQANIAEHQRYNGELEQKRALVPECERLLKQAQAKVKESEAKLMRYQVEKMPKQNIDLSDRLQAWVQYHAMLREIGKKLESWPAKTGVMLLSGFQLPPPSPDPNQIPYPLLTFPIGQVHVRASSFKTLLDHVRAWNKVPNLLVQVDGLTIQGTSPLLNATYNLTVYVFPKASGGQVGPAVPTATGAEGGGGGGFAPPSMGMPMGFGKGG